jgi:predicted nuclease with RNAse H fold
MRSSPPGLRRLAVRTAQAFRQLVPKGVRLVRTNPRTGKGVLTIPAYFSCGRPTLASLGAQSGTNWRVPQ